MAIRLSLQRHPDTPCDPLAGIDIELARLAPLVLDVRYVLRGAVDKISLRTPDGEELWRHTCFEAFLRVEGEEEYLEYNVAPSGLWNVYSFRGYREGRERGRWPALSRLDVDRRTRPLTAEKRARYEASGLDSAERFGPTYFTLKAQLALPLSLDVALHRPWLVGLSTVVEERNGRISYWALAHPPGDPDFHHPSCFALRLPAAMPA
jgi:hypothetical protein